MYLVLKCKKSQKKSETYLKIPDLNGIRMHFIGI